MDSVIKYAIIRTIVEKKQASALPGYAAGVTRDVSDEMVLFLGEYDNPNVIDTGAVTYDGETWKCDHMAATDMLYKLPLLDRHIPLSFIIQHDEAGRITAWQQPVSLALLDVKEKRGEHYKLVSGEIPTDISLTDGFWFGDGTLQRRPDNPTTVRGEERTLYVENVPDGSQVTISVDGNVIPIDDYTIEVDEPGAFSVHVVSPFPTRETRYDVQVE